MNKLNMNEVSRRRWTKTGAAFAAAAAAVLPLGLTATSHAEDLEPVRTPLYWDTNGTNPGIGGTGTSGSTRFNNNNNVFSQSADGTGPMQAFPTTNGLNDAVFGATPTGGGGTVEWDRSLFGDVYLRATYRFRPRSSTRYSMGGLHLSDNVTLFLDGRSGSLWQVNNTFNTVGRPGVTLGENAQLVLNAGATTPVAFRSVVVNALGGTSPTEFSAPLLITGTGLATIEGGISNSQAQAGDFSVPLPDVYLWSGNIVGNENTLTLAGTGAASFASVRFSGNINNGAGDLRISTNKDIGNTRHEIHLDTVSSVWGDTNLDMNSSDKFIYLNRENVLPTGTTLRFNAESLFRGSNTVVLWGNNTEIGQLTSAFNSTTSQIRNDSNDDVVLTISGDDATQPAYTGTILDGAASFAGKLALVRSGSGTTTLGGNANSYTGGTTIRDTSTLALTANATIGSGALTLDGGTLDVSGRNGATFTFDQAVSGVGTINATGKTLVFNHSIAPGNSPGGINILGDATLSSTASLNMEIEGVDPGMFDFLHATGALTYGGVLNLLTDYAATLGDSVKLFDGNDYAGAFADVTGTSLGGGLFWDTSSLSVDGTITVVPEPASLALLAAGGLLIGTSRRRRVVS